MSDTTNPSELWKTEFNRRITAFSKAAKIDESIVLEKLAELGVDAESSDSLDYLDNPEFLRTSDLFSVFVDSKIAPIVRVRAAEPHLRGRTQNQSISSSSDPVVNALNQIVSSNKPKTEWSDEELLQRLDDTAFEEQKILNERTKGRACIVFNNNGTVDIPNSLELVRIAKKQVTSKQHRIGNRIVAVFRAGEFPARMLNESPFFPGSVLVKDYCSNSDTNWEGIDLETRILCRLYATQCELTKLSKKQMKDIVADAKKGIEFFKDNYSEAVLVYEKLQSQGRLPTLKISENEVKSSGSSSKDTAF